MPRPIRHFLPEVSCHIVQRGNNRQVCFYTQRDYAVYLSKLRDYSRKFGVAIHSFVLMTNHVHLLATPSTTSGLSQLMQSLGGAYVRYVNDCYDRTGTLWEGRFKASLVDSLEYSLTVSRYIELNPVRACMVTHPGQYPWSSYKCNALGARSRIISKSEAYLGLGSSPAEREQTYRDLCGGYFSKQTLDLIRESCNKTWVLGSKRFKKQIEQELGFALPPFPRGGARVKSNGSE